MKPFLCLVLDDRIKLKNADDPRIYQKLDIRYKRNDGIIRTNTLLKRVPECVKCC